jgi:hypothetical protein
MAKGSALSTPYPGSGLYPVLVADADSQAGMKPSQIPDVPRAARGWLLLSQPLKSPTTETRSAFGAQTAK